MLQQQEMILVSLLVMSPWASLLGMWLSDLGVQEINSKQVLGHALQSFDQSLLDKSTLVKDRGGAEKRLTSFVLCPDILNHVWRKLALVCAVS
jgi:hypothetical protein